MDTEPTITITNTTLSIGDTVFTVSHTEMNEVWEHTDIHGRTWTVQRSRRGDGQWTVIVGADAVLDTLVLDPELHVFEQVAALIAEPATAVTELTLRYTED